MSDTSKSPWIIHYDGSSCNGCDIEVLACLTPMYDVERSGVINTGNPKHADVFLITGAVNERNIGVVKQIYSQMLEPKVVVACGACACSGGIFHDCYNVIGGVDKAIPVDAYVPGCAVRPEALIDAVVAGLGILEEKRAALELAGNYEPKERTSPSEQEQLEAADPQPLLEEPAEIEAQADIDVNADEEPGE